MKNLLPLIAILLISALPVTAHSLPTLHNMNSSYLMENRRAQDQPVHDVALYPNPVTEGRLTVTSQDNIVFVQVLNITGKIVYEQEFPSNTNSVELQLDKLEKGIYLVRIGFPGKDTHTEKIMIK